MRVVRQNDKSRRNGAATGRRRRAAGRSRIRGGIAALTAAAIASGCAQGDGGGRDGGGGHAAVRPTPSGRPLKAPPPVETPDAHAKKFRSAHAARVAAARRWRLARVPLTPPSPPTRKPEITTRNGFEVDGHAELGLPPVFTTVPTKQRVVFLTIDDGAEKDPAFLRMMSDLKVPYTAFLSDYLIKEDYGYFKRMQRSGVVLNNHTLHHPYLPALSYHRQKYEICGMQEVIERRYGKRPLLFRPPFGNYNRNTLRAAKSCGIEYVPLWNEEVFVDHWDYREWDRKIRPGDIVLSHFRGRADWKGTMPDMIRRFLNKVTAEGYAVARLEDYL
ncbi:polysaccharide deacetylase family protein [Streptomyces regalis]|uniref:Polysaccharide deacetylase n=1 Tax=Streptomyces regalis TaxID=68262 RepID=A0A101JC67_9ACTN|nr:polysaccharide deacetylase family protein [Streptomyces regalis]KUL24083.1 polysaccharide deacetylase [Streptomyces regalis]